MTSINKIKKVKYIKNTADIINLEEYILFEDEVRHEKCIVFKFHNNLNQNINEFTFEVSQYDDSNFLVEKSIVSYDEPLPDSSNNYFVPKSKLVVNYECSRIECHLVKARFERVCWENGEFIPIKYTISDFRNEYNPSEKSKIEHKKEKKPQKIKNSKNKFKIKDITKSNLPKGHIIYAVITSIILILGIIAGSILYKMTNYEYYNGVFQYEVNNNDNTCIITGYDSSDDSVVIPNLINNQYTVIGIGKYAFKNSNVSSIRINALNLYIDDYAFYGSSNLKEFIQNEKVSNLSLNTGVFAECTSLEKIELNNVSDIYEYTFKNCVNLKTLILPESRLHRNSLYGCENLLEVHYNDTDRNTTFKDLFANTSINVTKVTTNNNIISSNYFGEIPSINNINLLNENVIVEFGAYKGLSIPNYYGNNTIEYFNGDLNINKSTNEFIIDGFPSSIINQIMDKINPYCNSLIIDDENLNISSSMVNKLKSLKEVTILNCKSIGNNAFSGNSISLILDSKILDKFTSYQYAVNQLVVTKYYSNTKLLLNYFPNLVEVTMPYIEKSLYDLGLTTNIRRINLTESIGKEIPFNYADNYMNLEELVFPEGIEKANSYVVNNCQKLTKLVLPKSITSISNKLIGENCYMLSDVTLPFVGENSDTPEAYSNINLSYMYTKYLTILKPTYGGEMFSKGLEDVIGIDFRDEVKNTKYLLNYCTKLRYLRFTNNNNITDLSNNDNNLYLEWLFLDNVNEIYLDYNNIIIGKLWVNNMNPFNTLNTLLLEKNNTIIYYTKSDKINYSGKVYYNVSETYENITKK